MCKFGSYAFCQIIVERSNLSIGKGNRRITRLTNAFSKKVGKSLSPTSLYFTFYNFCRIYKSLSVTPAMQAGLMKKPMTIEDIANLLQVGPKTRGKCKTD
jgi:hypothetical protein